MFKLTIMYAVGAEQFFDFDYYLIHHIPMSIRLQGKAIRTVQVEQGYESDLPEITCKYRTICHFTYDSEQAFLDAFLPVAETLQSDIPRFTDSDPIIQFSNLLLSQ